MYGKVFASMYDGSLYGNWKAIITLQQMIVLADCEGFVDMTPQALAARTSIPLDIIREGIELLEQPDKYSRSADCDGRRIELVDDTRPWGWRIINYVKYRQLASAEEKREADRLRIAAKRLIEKNVAECREQSQPVANVAYAEAEEEEEVEEEGKEEIPRAKSARVPSRHIELIFRHWQKVHEHPKANLDDARRKLIAKALKGYSLEQLRQCIDGYKLSPFHQGQNPAGTVYDDIETMLRNVKQIEQGIKFVERPASQSAPTAYRPSRSADELEAEAKARGEDIWAIP